MRVTIICGGLTHERDVSLRSGRRVAESLRHHGHQVEVADVNTALLPTLAAQRPDVVWPLVHGSVGEDGSLQAVLELVGYQFVGSQAAACALTLHKPTAKELLRRAGLHTPAWVALPRTLFSQLGADALVAAVREKFPCPVVVKPSSGGSSLGVTIARTDDDLRTGLVNAFSYGEHAMIEEFVAGTEVAISVQETDDGLLALPAVEIHTDEGTYDYDARYNAGRSEFFVPARLDPETATRAAEAALLAHQTLGLRDLSRTDMIIAPDGTPFVIDSNTAPGMTDTSLLPLAAEEYDSFDAFTNQVVQRVAARAAGGVTTS
ncbi:D-alanine--D-alanine ligase family protein [Buchananella hordeovulneris]|uniref:D-alanine--D-alanine ligase family protein n=1 Tax=Buchananella hordeovulneris TaxID=52770 RepID=UPI0026DA8736|nr:D-alanine--D-alanine ligase [Buchananella hordeovulneris]MDO5080022.1 D-alanine--D-alanine ligase [Buchananella hordeovulneris]